MRRLRRTEYRELRKISHPLNRLSKLIRKSGGAENVGDGAISSTSFRNRCYLLGLACSSWWGSQALTIGPGCVVSISRITYGVQASPRPGNDHTTMTAANVMHGARTPWKTTLRCASC